MDDAGQKLKRARERLGLRYRDVEEISQQIADRRKNSEFGILLSRLSDIENRGVVPSLFKLYSLCAIYRLDMAEVARWYGVEVSQLASDAAALTSEKTHLIGLGREKFGLLPAGDVQVPLALDPGLDLKKTTFLTRFIQSWGVLPLMLVAGLDLKNHRYAYVGTEDLFMYPILLPGSLLLLDESRKKIASGPWASTIDRPIYFLEYRDGWMCGWCSLVGDTLIAQPHPASGCLPVVFQYPSDVDIIGQVTGVANRLDGGPPRRTRS